jgi:hypothetical protein
MSDDEKVEPCEDNAKKGYFDSGCRLELFPALVDYPGHFTLPNPFLDRHTKVWWEIAINPLKKLSEFDFAFYDGEWQAAIKLNLEYGEWDIEGVPVGDLTTDSVPAIVKAWVMQEASSYIYPFLPFNIRRKILGIM